MTDVTNLKLKRNLTSLVEFSRVINSSFDLQFILNNVLLSCLGKFLSTKGLIALSENGKIVIKNSKGLSDEIVENFPELHDEPRFIYPCQDPLCATTKQPQEVIAIIKKIEGGNFTKDSKFILITSSGK